MMGRNHNNGGPSNHVEFLLDGAPNNTVYGRANRIAYVPSVDAVEEFKVMTSVYDAQYGRSGGGVINVSIKSGQNSADALQIGDRVTHASIELQ